MKCLIPGINVKVLARAIHALAKFGEELYIEPLTEGISFRTVNSSRSAYASFNFSPSFFINYCDASAAGQEDDEDSVKCKISMKSCIAVFKSPNSIDKHVETCMLKLEPEDKKLIFQFRCRYGIIKNHCLPIIECETLQAVYTRNLATNVLIAEPKLLVDALHNFHHNQEELTFAVTPSKIVMRNFTDFTPDPMKVIRTELCLESGEFVQYKVRQETSITFCLKEFRALLSFAESVMLPIAINFETAGRPAVFVVSNPHTFEVNFVLATLMEQGDSQQPLTPASTSMLSKKRPSASTNLTEDPNRTKRAKGASTEEPHMSDKSVAHKSAMGRSSPKTNLNDQHSLDNLEEEFDVEWENFNDDAAIHEDAHAKKPSGKSEIGVTSVQNRLARSHLENYSMDSGSPRLMDYTQQSDASALPSSNGGSVVYRRCFQDTFNPRNLPGYDEILAPDSDEEPD